MRNSFVIFSALASVVAANPLFTKRLEVSWGPICGFYQTNSQIISTTSTFYPGAMPQDQQGYMFNWIGISNTTGDLVQSIVGNYPKGSSECSGAAADTAWCVSSEVYGLNDKGQLIQFVGDKRTADTNSDNGVIFQYTLVDRETYLWNQTMTDAVTGELLSTYQKKSGMMSLWNTAVELQPFNGAAATSLQEDQIYLNTTIILDPADPGYGDLIVGDHGATYTKPTTSDGGKTVSFNMIHACVAKGSIFVRDLSEMLTKSRLSGTLRRSPYLPTLEDAQCPIQRRALAPIKLGSQSLRRCGWLGHISTARM